MKDKHWDYKRTACVLAAVIACVILLLPISTKVTIVVQYGQKNADCFSQIYFDTGNGIREEESVRKKIKSKNCKYVLPKTVSKLKGFRLDPVNDITPDEVVLKSVSIYGKDGLTTFYSGESLADIWTLQNDLYLVSCDSEGLCLQVTGQDAQLSAEDVLVKDIRKAASRNYVARGWLILALLIILFLILEYKKIKGILPSDRLRWLQLIIMTGAVCAVGYYLKRTYGKGYGFYGQMLIVCALLFYSNICLLRRTNHHRVITAEKIVSLFILGQTICGSGLFDKVYSAFDDEIVFYLICLMIQIAIWGIFWIGEKRSGQYLLFIVSIWVFRYSICIWGYEWDTQKSVINTVNYLGTVPGMLSFMGISALYCVLWGVFGKGIASVLYTAAWIFVFSANMIEMVYHATFVKAIDVLSLGDLKAILHNYVENSLGIVILFLCLGCLYLCYRNRSKVLAYLLPDRNSATLVAGLAITIWLLSALDTNVYMDCFGINNANNWSLEVSMEKKQGFFAFSYINLRRFLSLVPQEPENYRVETIENTLSVCPNADEDTLMQWSQQPDVIFLMLEAIVDPDMLSEAYGVQYSEDPDPTLDEYALTTTLAAIFGGYTAKSEFEALTGMSDIFFQSGTVAYSAYFSNQAEPVYSIVDVFKNEGYYTTAIHQNDRTFYNRDAAYRSMGFDQFIAKGDYEETEQDYNEDNYLRNSHLLPLITKQLDSTTQPQLIWGVTIESHSPYDHKYAQTDIDVTCDDLNEAQISELENYIQSVKNTDNMIKELIAYLDKRDRPALLFVFGDHLPRLGAWDVWGTSAEPDKYYATVCAAYSTEGNVSVEDEYLSMNYLAPLVVHSAGISNAPFYNYLWELHKDMPVIRNWRMDEEAMQKLEIYEMMQYDMLFKKAYFHNQAGG